MQIYPMPNHLVRGRYMCCRIGAEKSSKLIQPNDICPTLAAINNLRLILTPLSKSPAYTALLATDTSKVPSHLLIRTQIWTRETPALERDLGAPQPPPSKPQFCSIHPRRKRQTQSTPVFTNRNTSSSHNPSAFSINLFPAIVKLAHQRRRTQDTRPPPPDPNSATPLPSRSNSTQKSSHRAQQQKWHTQPNVPTPVRSPP